MRPREARQDLGADVAVLAGTELSEVDWLYTGRVPRFAGRVVRIDVDDSIRGDDYLSLMNGMFGAEQAERNWQWLSSNVDVLLDKAPTPAA